MALILFKWLFVACLTLGTANTAHPVFMSVTEIEHNAKEQTLEISCKVFTDDFEQTLRKVLKIKNKIDLLNPVNKAEMNEAVREYLQKHLGIAVNGKDVPMNFLGYEQHEEGIVSYFQVDNISAVKEIVIKDDILYEYKTEQMSILHVTVNGIRKSTKLLNPASKAVFRF